MAKATVARPAPPPPKPASDFESLDLAPALLAAVKSEGYATPTPIQALAIPPALEGRDVLGIAQTGTGKTAAFALPILELLVDDLVPGKRLASGRAPRALVLAPTRELAAQIGASFATYGAKLPLRHAVIFGGVGQSPQVDALRSGTDVLVATPGRLLDLMDQRLVDLRAIEFFVLDEADRMLDMGFIQPIRKISAALPKGLQTMMFSATMPKEIQHLADALLDQPAKVSVAPAATTVERVTQGLYFVPKAKKVALLVHVLADRAVARVLVFTRTKHGADRVVRKLKGAGIPSLAIHGNKGQSQRTRALAEFKSGATRVLVATDIAARGLDVDDITHVVNFDLPVEPEAYVHRIGRTARAGASGIAISFCDDEERDRLKDIERLTRVALERLELPRALPEPPARTAEDDADDRADARHAARLGGGGRRSGGGGRSGSGGSRGGGGGGSHAGRSQAAGGGSRAGGATQAPRDGRGTGEARPTVERAPGRVGGARGPRGRPRR